MQLVGWRRISAINSIMTPVCKSTLIVPKDAQRFNSKCFIWESFSSSALAAFSSSLDGSCLNDSKIHRPSFGSFGRNRGWTTWECTEYSICQTGWDMSHYVPPILNFVKELHVAKQHPSRWISLCESSKAKTDHFRMLLPFQNASPVASFFSSPFSSRKPPLTTHPTKASALFLASALEGEGDFLAWQKLGQTNDASNEDVSNEESFNDETANAPHNPLASYTKSEEVRGVPEFEMVPNRWVTGMLRVWQHLPNNTQFHRCPSVKTHMSKTVGHTATSNKPFTKGIYIYWVYLSSCSIITSTIYQDKQISGSFYGYIWHLASTNNIHNACSYIEKTIELRK